MKLKRKFNFFRQRLARGWDDTELWSLDHTFAEWIVPRLKRVKEIKHGVPISCFETEDHEAEHETAKARWEAIMDEMILGFENKALEWDIYAFDVIPHYERAKELFAKHLDDLWD